MRTTLLLALLCLPAAPASADLAKSVQEYKDSEAERACRREVTSLVSTMYALSYTCAARCSRDNLWLGFTAASGGTAQAAYDAAAASCENARMSIVNKTVSCLNNYWAASYHEDLDADCPKRKAALEAELTTPRMSCTASLADRSAYPLIATVSVSNAAKAYASFAAEASRRDAAFKAFAPASDCSWLRY